MQALSRTGVAVADDSYFEVGSDITAFLRTHGLTKIFHSGAHEIRPLNGVDLTVEKGEIIAIVGPSGSGKSTLLHLLAALDTPTSGEVYFARNSLWSLSEEKLAEYRNRVVGFVWQRHHLLPDFTAAENAAMPLLLRGQGLKQSLKTAGEWLGEVGLGDREGQQAGELSGGEQQRVAIARALANQPAVLLADEPTGDLDERNAEGIFELMQRLHHSHRLTTILATHNLSLARRTDRVLALEHGKLAPAVEPHPGAELSPAQFADVGAKTLGERG
jgi:lipoprotein-releasing system ATP-binding protein